MSVSTCLNRLSKSSFTKSLFDCCFVILTTISVVTYELVMSFDIVISNLCVSILFREIETEIPCPVKIIETIGVLIRIGWTFDEVVSHSLNEWLCKWSSLEVSNNVPTSYYIMLPRSHPVFYQPEMGQSIHGHLHSIQLHDYDEVR